MHITDGLLFVSLDFHPRNLVYSTTNFLGKRQFIYFSTLIFFHQMTPLHLAAATGRIGILGHLVDQGAYINIQDDKGVNILCDST